MAFFGDFRIFPAPEPPQRVCTISMNGLECFDPETCWNKKFSDWGNYKAGPGAGSFVALYQCEGVLGLGHDKHIRRVADLILSERAKRPEGEVNLIGHSDGARATVQGLLLANPVGATRTAVDNICLIAPWLHHDCNRNGINYILKNNLCRRLFLCVSKNDGTLGWNNWWPPYRDMDLGKVGPESVNPVVEDRLFIWQDDSQDHSTWVQPRPKTTDESLGFNLSVLSTTLKRFSEPYAE